jgi:hypothetical protein
MQHTNRANSHTHLGTTMRAAGLEIVETIMETEAVLITNPNSKHKDVLATLKKRIEGYLTATKYSVGSWSQVCELYMYVCMYVYVCISFQNIKGYSSVD